MAEDRLLEAHVQEDRDRFEAIRVALEKIDQKLDLARIELAEIRGATRSTRMIGGIISFVVSIAVTLLISGIFSSCS